MALIHFMRLSLMKGAHADLSSTARQETGVKPGFGLSGIPQDSTSVFLSLMQTSPEMRQDGLAVSDTRNKANRGNREVTYNAYIAFSALFSRVGNRLGSGGYRSSNHRWKKQDGQIN